MKPTKDSKKNRIYALFGLLLVFLLAVDFVLFATGTITLSKPENDTSTIDCGLIVVMSTDCGAAIGNIRDISKVTYDYFNPGTKEDLTYKTLLRD